MTQELVNFFHYFSYNFEVLDLKKLLTTCYKNQNPDLFNQNDFEKAISLEYKRDKKDNLIPYPDYMKKLLSKTYPNNKDENNVIDLEEIGVKELDENGDFRSQECIELLKEADIVVTNPPFSLFREYVAQLIKYDKKFLVVGHQNAITYKEIFKLIKESKIWLGYGFKGGAGHFITDYNDHASANDHKEGMIRVSGVNWFTNLDIQKRHEDLILYKKYNSSEYPEYENYDAINVDKTKDIPMDYDSVMGVPITFLDKYNPKQFEIVALGIVGSINFTKNKQMEILDKNGQRTGKFVYNAKGTLYKKYDYKKDKKPAFRDCENGQLYSSIYARVLIRKKQ